LQFILSDITGIFLLHIQNALFGQYDPVLFSTGRLSLPVAKCVVSWLNIAAVTLYSEVVHS